MKITTRQLERIILSEIRGVPTNLPKTLSRGDRKTGRTLEQRHRVNISIDIKRTLQDFGRAVEKLDMLNESGGIENRFGNRAYHKSQKLISNMSDMADDLANLLKLYDRTFPDEIAVD